MGSTRVAMLGTGGTIASTSGADGQLVARRSIAELLDDCEIPAGVSVEPAADSTWVIAWYSCPRCGHEWSARIRNGRPDALSIGEVLVRGKTLTR